MPGTYNCFGATADDVLHQFQGATAVDFETAPDAGDGETELEAALVAAEGLVLAYLPPRYRKLFARVEGEILARAAEGGELEAELGLAPAEPANLRVWRGWPLDGTLPPPIAARRWGWSLDEQTLTLETPLATGETLIVSYDVDPEAWALPALQRTLVALAGYSLAERLHAVGDPGWQKSRAAFDAALAFLRDLRDGNAGLAELERLELVGGSGERAAGAGGWRPLGRA